MDTPSSTTPLEHRLLNKWTYWFDSNKYESMSSSAQSSIEEVYTFSTAEEFWGLYDGLYKSTSFPKGSDCFYLKYGVKPSDIDVRDGGKLKFAMKVNNNSEECWMYLV